MARKNSDGAGGLVKARALADVNIEGVQYLANDVISLDSALCAEHVAAGSLDVEPAAVAYCETELGATARDHAAEAAPIFAARAAQAEANDAANLAREAQAEATAKALEAVAAAEKASAG